MDIYGFIYNEILSPLLIFDRNYIKFNILIPIKKRAYCLLYIELFNSWYFSIEKWSKKFDFIDFIDFIDDLSGQSVYLTINFRSEIYECRKSIGILSDYLKK